MRCPRCAACSVCQGLGEVSDDKTPAETPKALQDLKRETRAERRWERRFRYLSLLTVALGVVTMGLLLTLLLQGKHSLLHSM